MAIIGKGTLSEFRENYKKNTGRYPTPLGDIIGIMQHDVFYWQQEMLAEFVDSIFPDWFPVDVVQNVLIKSIGQTYYNRKWNTFDQGAEQGNAIWNDTIGKIDELRKKLETDFNNLLNDAKTKLQNQINDITDYAKSKIAELDTLTKDAQAEVEKAKIAINDAVRDIQKHASDIKELFDRVKTLEGQIREQKDSFEWLRSVLKIG